MLTQDERDTARRKAGDTLPPDAPVEPTQDLRISEILIEDILNWRRRPGEWIREREIAERFDVSHGPVREAFRRLERNGFVELVPWRGARIITLDAKRARDVIEHWKLLFGNVCGMAALRMSPDDKAVMMQLIAGYEAVVRATNDPIRHFSSSNFVGQYISDRCGNAVASDALSRAATHTRWQYGLLRAQRFAHLYPAAGIRSASLFRIVGERILAGDSIGAELAGRDLIAYPEASFAEAVADHLAVFPEPAAPKRQRPSVAGQAKAARAHKRSK